MAREQFVNPEALRYYRYRRQFHESDKRQMTIVIIGATLALCATIRNDFILLSGTPFLGLSLALRFVQFSATVGLLILLQRAKKPHQLDWIGGTWTILTTLVLAATGLGTRLPLHEVLGPIFGGATAITIFYFAQRGRLLGRLIANGICTLFLLVLLWHPLSPVNKVAKTTGPVVIVLLNIIGIASARSFEDQRRKRFEAERLERQARQELAVKNRELAIEKEHAETIYRARTAFLAAMSHEFRTPMNAVIGLSELLVNAPLELEYREHARTIRDSASALLGLLNDVLDFAKIDSGKLELSPVPFDLRALLGSIVDMMQPAAEAKQIELTWQFSSDLPEHIIGDNARLRQVLANLLSNAIKFTAKGTVTFTVTARASDKHRRAICFSINDTGIGMSPEVMTRLFRPFEQGDGGVSRRYGGSGLGLVISRQIVMMMGGDIAVESSPGKGSTFSFTIHVPETPATKRLLTRGVQGSKHSRKRLNILVVDDLAINRTVARVMLERLGYQADFANDGHAAIDAVTNKAYDVVFMDLQMPHISGIETTKRMTEKFAGQPMPQIIAMSASVFEEDRAACRAAGMSDFVAKPIDLGQLELVLERIAGNCANEIEKTAKPSLDLAPIDRLRQLESLGEPGFVAELCREFLADTPVRIQRMKDALKRDDLKELERDAHSLKSSSASLGAMEMSQISAQIESSARQTNVGGVETLLEQLTLEIPRVESGLRAEGLA